MKVRIIICIIAALLLLGSSPWEGAAAVAPEGVLPSSGFFVATNSFPRNTIVEITNIETGRRTTAIVANTLDSPGLLAVVSQEAAELINMRQGSISRIRMIAPQEPIAYQRFIEGLISETPGFDSGNVIRSEEELLAELYNEDSYRPPAPAPIYEEPPAVTVTERITGPSYIPEPEWGGTGRINIVDIPRFNEEPHEIIVIPVTEEPVSIVEAEPEIAEDPEYVVEAAPEVIEEPEYVVEAEPEVAEEPEYIVEAEPEVIEEPEYIVEVVPEVLEEPEYIVEVEPEVIEEPEYVVEAEPEIAEEPEYIVEVEPEVIEEPEYVVEAEPEVIEEPEYVVEAEPEISEEPEYIVEVEPEVIEEPEYIVEAEPEIAEEPEYIVEAEPEVIEEPEYVVEAEPEVIEEPEYIVEAEPEIAEEPEYIVEAEPEVFEEPVQVAEEPQAELMHPAYILVETSEQPPQVPVVNINLDDILPPAIAQVETPAPVQPVAAVETTSSSDSDRINILDRGKYYVQIASDRNYENAQNIARRVDPNFNPFVFIRGDEWYRVLIGPLNNPGEGAAVLQRFRTIGYSDAFVLQGS